MVNKTLIVLQNIHQMNEGNFDFWRNVITFLCAQKFVPTLILFREIIGQFSKNYHQ
jgi:hypothetical protein